MNYIIYGAILICLMLTSHYKVTVSGKNRMLYGITIAFFIAWILCVYYTSIHTTDSVSYEAMFSGNEIYRAALKNARVGFLFLADIIRHIGGNYSFFRMIIGLFYIIPILMILKGKYGDYLNKSFYLLLVMIYPFFISIGTLSFTVASGIDIISFYCYLSSKKRKRDALFVVFIMMIGVFFHPSSAMYIAIFCLWIVYCKVSIKRYLNILIILLDIIVILLLRTPMGYRILTNYGGTMVNEYVGAWSQSGYGWIITIGLQIAYLIILRKRKKKIEINCDQNIVDLYELLLNLSYVMLLFMPLYVIHVVFFRMFRGLLLLILVCYAIRIEKENKIRFSNIVLIVLQFFNLWYDSGLRIMKTTF